MSLWQATISRLLQVDTDFSRPTTASAWLQGRDKNNLEPSRRCLDTVAVSSDAQKAILFLINPKSGSGKALTVFNSQVRQVAVAGGDQLRARCCPYSGRVACTTR